MPQYIEIINPYTQQVIKKLELNTANDIEQALQKASALSNSGQQLSIEHRCHILHKTKQIMQAQIEDLTLLATQEGGKPYQDSKIEVKRAINGIQLAIDNIGQTNHQCIPMELNESSKNRMTINIREPIGLVVAVSAFNHPLNLSVHQIIPAIAVGCPVIIKPDLRTPLSCQKLIDILYQAGLPTDWCQSIICDNQLAEKLVTDARVQYFSFIGSARIGWYLRSKLPAGTRCALEHGGAAPVIVEPDADFKHLIPSLIKGGFYHAGQVCVSVQRIFAHESICQQLVNDLTKAVSQLTVGDPENQSTEVGPMIETRELQRIDNWVQEAVQQGAQLITGGKPISKTCYAPTILLNPSQSSKVSQMEIFGPVICIYDYQNLEKAINQANDLPYAFQSAVFTENINKAITIAKKLDATAVMINDHTAFRVDWMPFGGRKQSGLGMGGIPYSMHELTQTKMLVINSKPLPDNS